MRAESRMSEARSGTYFLMFDLVMVLAVGAIGYAVLRIATSHSATRAIRVARQAAEGTFRSGYLSGVLLGLMATALVVLAVAFIAGLLVWGRQRRRRPPRSRPNTPA